jgi:hypothetical protein
MPPQTNAEQPRQAQPGSDTGPGTTVPGTTVPGTTGPGPAQLASPLSRRSMLRGAAGVGAVGLAAAAGAGAVFAATRPADTTRPAGAAAPKGNGEPLVVYLRDTSTGEFEIFNGTRQVRLRNPALVAQLLDGLQTAK